MKKIFFLLLFTLPIFALDKTVLDRSFETFQKNPSMKLIIYFHGFGQFDSSSSIFYNKSGPPNAEDIIEDIKVYSNYIHLKYTNRGKGEYYNDLYISIPHITVIHNTKSSLEIYIGNPKIVTNGK